ncbi:hypothetical protein HMPREF1861_01120 [Corynebacterium kroppenstedtii]|nr:hypothetical protein HMPREF1861_01120 [Corynebacterium kroppenstedtii]
MRPPSMTSLFDGDVTGGPQRRTLFPRLIRCAVYPLRLSVLAEASLG